MDLAIYTSTWFFALKCYSLRLKGLQMYSNDHFESCFNNKTLQEYECSEFKTNENWKDAKKAVVRQDRWFCSERSGGLMVGVLDNRANGLGSSCARDSVLCSWVRHLTLMVPLSTQMYKWVLGNNQEWTSIPSRGHRNTPCCLMLMVLGILFSCTSSQGSNNFCSKSSAPSSFFQ